MRDIWQPDAVIKAKLEQIKKTYFEYINQNIETIDTNVPVFFAQLFATLEKSVPDLSDELHDQFIDNITIHVFRKSRKADDIVAVEKLFDYAMRNKRNRSSNALCHISLGLRMISAGRYTDAINKLVPYRNLDASICTAVAYCHFVLSTQQSTSHGMGDTPRHRTQRALPAREQMIELVHMRPPVNWLKEMNIYDDPVIDKYFWFMIRQAIEWFPSERTFLVYGVEKATKDQRMDLREEILGLAIERFANDMFFLRESYNLKMEKRDAAGVAGVVKQMCQYYPDELEPIYYGLKVAIITTKVETYHRFRKLALVNRIPQNMLALLDFAFEMVSGNVPETRVCMDEIKQKFTHDQFFVTLLEYVASDLHSSDEKKVRQAKKALIDSIDGYCLTVLKIKTLT
ncbi:hypothetical protein [uncultured Methanoregula sp.]|uniref:hypothetical protein n=1 Tax=uncultured Methanoregula sp. TaxID=1005933 RepID=UPI002AAC154A|nr:hypothetical protein [uncultured Methanoregula sp.]